MENKQNNLNFLLLIVIAFLIIFGGIYFLLHRSNTQNVISIPIAPNPSATLYQSMPSQNIPQSPSPSADKIISPATAKPVISQSEVNCGIQTYASITAEGQGIATSACFNKQFNMCQPAKISGTVTAYNATTQYEIVGKSSGLCRVVETVTAPTLPQSTTLSCLFDNMKSFAVAASDSSRCVPE